MPFINPRTRLQLPFHTSADMESMSVHWITQTKTHSTRTVEQENQSQWTRSQTVNRGLNHLSNTFTVQAINPEPGVKQCLKQILALKIQCQHKTSTRSGEQSWWAHAGTSPAVKLPWHSFLSCGLKIFLELSFRWQHTCCNYSFLVWSLLGVSREPGKALPALYCTNVWNT